MWSAPRYVILLCVFTLLAPAHADHAPPAFEVNLDLPPQERWREAVDGILDVYGWDQSFRQLAAFVEEFAGPEVLAKAERFLEALDARMEGAYGQEIRGLHAALADRGHGESGGQMGLSLGEVTVLNLIYELTVWCTSIVAETSDGRILHGRNLDYSLETPKGSYTMQNITANVRFTRDGQSVYETPAFVGYVGVLTGLRHKDPEKAGKGWTISMDQREYLNAEDMPSQLVGYLENVVSSAEGGLPVGFFLRDTMEQESSYDAALKRLAEARLVSPAYLIVGGVEKGEGAVITRDRSGPDESRGEGIWAIQDEEWYRLETNFDHWLTMADAKSDEARGRLWRRANATVLLEAMGQEGINAASLEAVLKTPPILNSNTQYTSIMSAGDGAITTTVRDRCWTSVYTPCADVEAF